MEWREQDGVRWLEAELPGACVAFSTRMGGTSDTPFDGLNLGALTDDDLDAVAENRRRLAAALRLPLESVACAHQVHGSELIVHAETPLRHSLALNSTVGDEQGRGSRSSSAPAPDADGHVVTEPGIAALVFVADCIPVALSGPAGVAMLHCGWRGLAAGLVARGAKAIGATEAAIGPSIGPCCYEVGEEVRNEFATLGEGVASGRQLDLPEIASRLLHDAGVQRVESSGLCTSCEEELFFSHRRDVGRTGRQAGLVWLRDGGR